MELKQLLYFQTIAECNNMSQAAQKLNISQPALSNSLKKLEEELDAHLFERQKNKIILNESGKTALSYASAILDKAAEMKNNFYQPTSQTLLKLGFGDPGPMRFSVPLLQKTYPNISVTSEVLENEDHLDDLLLTHKYDAVISLQKPTNPSIVTIPFVKEELLLSVPNEHLWASRPNICLHNEKSLEMIVYCGNGSFVRQIQPLLDWLTNRHDVKLYNDYFVFRQLLENNKIATFTTRLVQHYRHDGNNRVSVPLTDSGVTALYYLSYLKNSKKHITPLLKWLEENSPHFLE